MYSGRSWSTVPTQMETSCTWRLDCLMVSVKGCLHLIWNALNLTALSHEARSGTIQYDTTKMPLLLSHLIISFSSFFVAYTMSRFTFYEMLIVPHKFFLSLQPAHFPSFPSYKFLCHLNPCPIFSVLAWWLKIWTEQSALFTWHYHL